MDIEAKLGMVQNDIGTGTLQAVLGSSMHQVIKKVLRVSIFATQEYLVEIASCEINWLKASYFGHGQTNLVLYFRSDHVLVLVPFGVVEW